MNVPPGAALGPIIARHAAPTPGPRRRPVRVDSMPPDALVVVRMGILRRFAPPPAPPPEPVPAQNPENDAHRGLMARAKALVGRFVRAFSFFRT